MLTTRYAVILLARLDQNGIPRVPGGTTELPGFFVEPDHTIALAKQVGKFMAIELSEPALASTVSLSQIISPALQVPGHGEATLLLCKCSSPWPKDVSALPTISAMLRALPKTKNRASYNKAWQYLMGIASEEMRVVEIEGPLPLE